MTTIGSDDEVTAVSDSEDEATVSFEFDDEGDRERQREREREREREAARHTDRHAGTQADRQTGRQAGTADRQERLYEPVGARRL